MITRCLALLLVLSACDPGAPPAAAPAKAPTDAKPAEAKPAEAKPAEAKPAEAKPAEAKPAEAPADPATNPPAAVDPLATTPKDDKKPPENAVKTADPLGGSGSSKVEGDGMEPDVIRRVVRAKINDVRACYLRALERDPDAKGRVAIQFKIGVKGRVEQAKVVESTLSDSTIGACIAKRVAGWVFPMPTDGKPVTVTYPFVLEPG